MSHPNFEELMTLSLKQRQEVYFQHRYIFNGQTYCCIDIPTYKSDIDCLKGALHIEYLQKPLVKVIPNSCIKFVSGQQGMKLDEACEKRVEILFALFDQHRLNNLILNLNYESFLQTCLDNNYSRALFYVLQFLLVQNSDTVY